MKQKIRLLNGASVAIAIALLSLPAFAEPTGDVLQAQPPNDAHVAVDVPSRAQTAAVAASATETSTVAATGVFVPPELIVVKRPAFGAAAGDATDYPAVKPTVVDSGLYFYIFGVSAALALVLTAGAAFTLSRSTKSDGTLCR
ncbi:MAG TPA: hypothetical protein VEB22_07695, partial [Phycisphaerales bacterium]|nr:hypothetical protein [Phycisphaerales bacterium]